MVKMTGDGGDWLKTAEANTGDVITFVDEGKWIESEKYTYDDGNPRKQFVMTVKIGGEEKSMNMNKTNRDIMTKAYGDESADWVGKSATIEKIKCNVAGKIMDSILLSVSGASEELPSVDVGKEDLPF